MVIESAGLCDICLSPMGAGMICAGCRELAMAYDDIDYQDVRAVEYATYAYHELAHYVLLTGKVPHTKDDTRVLEDIDLFTIGEAQLHEARTIALQVSAFAELGWAPNLRQAITETWDGVQRAETNNAANGGAVVFHSPQRMENWIKEHLPRGNSRYVRIYIRAVREFRGEL